MLHYWHLIELAKGANLLRTFTPTIQLFRYCVPCDRAKLKKSRPWLSVNKYVSNLTTAIAS
ncbi:MAG: hypothetical protein KA717_07950 [Woronichinia naegeliana WA131]|uniref:Uncharacterized protein n=1 Tax=Woronichinia naegeliana WA131 TaxID=2824559 RepID=A0A977KZA2_9CYAN|nr:MAG: hypothetical protein KA717_07950 [Woronichinia naegeliana WA131]